MCSLRVFFWYLITVFYALINFSDFRITMFSISILQAAGKVCLDNCFFQILFTSFVVFNQTFFSVINGHWMKYAFFVKVHVVWTIVNVCYYGSKHVFNSCISIFFKHFRNLKDIDMRQANRHSVNKRVPRFTSMEKIKFYLSSIGYSFYNDNTWRTLHKYM